MRDTVRFILNGIAVEVRAPDPTMTLLDWLRVGRRLTGTKEGCAEGDCGACTVMMVDAGGRVRAINSCITFLPMADGCAVTTVEGLGGGDPVQDALVEHHGSQCGFCTPGFVMSLHAHRARGGSGTRAAISDCIAGNLCRCTGYGPILTAGEEACRERVHMKLMAAQPDPVPLGYQCADGRAFHAPETLNELCALSEANPDATLLGGATDVGLWVTKQGKRPQTIISVMKVSELQRIEEAAGRVSIGAGVRYADAMAALVDVHPAFGDYLRRLGAAQVRDSGTIGGNIANGSPIGDMAPALIALGATIRLRRGEQEREASLEEFFIAYGKQDRAPGEVLTHIHIPKPPPDAFVAFEKVSKRFEQDISAVSAGLFVRVQGSVATEARLAFGGMAGTPQRARGAEAALIGKAWGETAVGAAMAALETDFTPLSDWRASAAYRLAAAQGLLLRFFHDTQGDGVKLSELVSAAHG
jgi:xanthine dehydrogenase small subunit